MLKSKIDLVLVTYYPDKKQLLSCIDSIKTQVRNIIIVSNNDEDFSFLSVDHIHINLKNNCGIAVAQNLGIKKAMEINADFVLTSDQDTVYPSNYVKTMFENYYNFDLQKEKIAAISPLFKDSGNNHETHPIVQWGKFGLSKNYTPSQVNEVSHVISSGMIIPSSVFNHIGLMEESFFIDWVDTEWCWRANSLGYKIIQFGDIYLNHSLGIRTQKILFASITKHNNEREYYKIRNAIFLFKNPMYSKINMRFYLLKSVLKNSVACLFRSTKSTDFLKSIYLGVFHGLKNKKNHIYL